MVGELGDHRRVVRVKCHYVVAQIILRDHHRTFIYNSSGLQRFLKPWV